MNQARTALANAQADAEAAGQNPDTSPEVKEARKRVNALQAEYDTTPQGISERVQAAAAAYPGSKEWHDHIKAARKGLKERQKALKRKGVLISMPGQNKKIAVTDIITPSVEDAIACRQYIDNDNARRAKVGKPAMRTEVPPLYELAPSQAYPFYQNMVATKNGGNKFAAAVYVYPYRDYKDMRMFMTPDGCSGVAVKNDGDIVSVHSITIEHRAYDNNSQNLVSTAVQAGGTHLDCFDTRLPEMYARCGFIETSRLEWDDQYAPEDWDYRAFESAKYPDGRPDVVFMEHESMANKR